jgi:hypothetical protein
MHWGRMSIVDAKPFMLRDGYCAQGRRRMVAHDVTAWCATIRIAGQRQLELPVE